MKFDDMCIPCCHPKCLGQCPADPHFHRNKPMPLTQQILSLTTVIQIHNYCLSHLSALLWLFSPHCTKYVSIHKPRLFTVRAEGGPFVAFWLDCTSLHAWGWKAGRCLPVFTAKCAHGSVGTSTWQPIIWLLIIFEPMPGLFWFALCTALAKLNQLNVCLYSTATSRRSTSWCSNKTRLIKSNKELN